ncbi:uncharacterized protein cfap90 isoform X2 [Xiphophorus couchianus]|uniref:uncharacterized protein cfap90 isoform X2 n=1 Tax=Xiphophorus couchianus TaxID=32473 RepID=UPI001016822F|nr:uncharacterized protein C5orf49 homolog isoform X2 [Xiphophorus couchianus]
MDASPEDQTKAVVKPSIFSLISPRRKEPKEMSYFNTKAKVTEVPMFDRMYHDTEDFDMKERFHTQKNLSGRGLDINEEVCQRSREYNKKKDEQTVVESGQGGIPGESLSYLRVNSSTLI